MRTRSLVTHLMWVLLAALGVMAALILWVARTGLQTNSRDLVAARQVKELAVTSLALLLRQDDITKAMLLDPDRLDQASEKIEAYDQNERVFAQMESLAVSPRIGEFVAQLRVMEERQLRPLDSEILERSMSGDLAGARTRYFTRYAPARTQYEDLLRRLGTVAEEDAADAARRMAARNDQAFRDIALALLLGTALTAGTLVRLGRRLRRRLSDMVDVLSSAAAGDLRRDLGAGSSDELGRIASSVNRMMNALRQVLGDIKGASEHLVVNSHELAHSAGESTEAMTLLDQAIEQITTGAMRQASATAEAVELIQALENAPTSIVARARQAAAAGERSSALVQGAGVTVQDALQGLQASQQHFRDAASVIREFGDLSRRIEIATKRVGNITEQTNLLALNATIEAAHAGVHGSGFAVVASEVRDLSRHAEAASEEIRQLAQAIEARTRGALEVVDRGEAGVAAGTQLGERAAAALHEILGAVAHVNAELQGVSGSALEVTASINRAVLLVSDVASVAQENAAAAEEMSAQSAQLVASIRNVSEFAAVAPAGGTGEARSLPALATHLQQLSAGFAV